MFKFKIAAFLAALTINTVMLLQREYLRYYCDNNGYNQSCFCFSENEKVQIPKVYSHYGFKYYLDAPTSSSVRKEDDKVGFAQAFQC